MTVGVPRLRSIGIRCPSVARTTAWAMGSVPHVELLERQSATASLRGALADATRGAGRMVFVSGEAGIGKTSLVRAFVADRPRGTRVLRGACDDLLTPAPARRRPRRGPPHPRPARRGAGRTGDVAAAVLAELSAGPPTVLVVEDLHWADEATLDLLAFLARRVGDLPCRRSSSPTATTRWAGHRRCAGCWARRRAAGARRAGPAVARRRDRARARTGPSRCTCTAARAATRSSSPSCWPRGRTAARHRQRRRARRGSRRLREATRRVRRAARGGPGPRRADAARRAAARLGRPRRARGGARRRSTCATARSPSGTSWPARPSRRACPAAVASSSTGPSSPRSSTRSPRDRARILHHADRCRDVDAVIAHGPAAARAAAAAGAHQQALAFGSRCGPSPTGWRRRRARGLLRGAGLGVLLRQPVRRGRRRPRARPSALRRGRERPSSRWPASST